MKANVAYEVKRGTRIAYDDGRPGHRDARGTVLEVTQGHGMLVQFDDRANTTYIRFSDKAWMDFITVVR